MNTELKVNKKNKSTKINTNVELDDNLKKDFELLACENDNNKKNKKTCNIINGEKSDDKINYNEDNNKIIKRTRTSKCSSNEEKTKKNIDKSCNEKNKKITYIDLFCGMGSFHYSFNKLGWKCLMSCDINKAARDNYNLNFNMLPLNDICDIDPIKIEKYDILCAGFPCQPFSQIGKHLGFKPLKI